jgi:hypothetical protein
MLNHVSTPMVEESAPSLPNVTPYDQSRFAIYLRLLDADAAHAPWEIVALEVLGLDVTYDPIAARATWQSHLFRARWMTEFGYRDLLHS